MALRTGSDDAQKCRRHLLRPQRIVTVAQVTTSVAAEWTPSRLGNLTGKRIIVTGATNGVGLATARALTRAGAHVILAVRSTELGAQTAARLVDFAERQTGSAIPV